MARARDDSNRRSLQEPARRRLRGAQETVQLQEPAPQAIASRAGAGTCAGAILQVDAALTIKTQDSSGFAVGAGDARDRAWLQPTICRGDPPLPHPPLLPRWLGECRDASIRECPQFPDTRHCAWGAARSSRYVVANPVRAGIAAAATDHLFLGTVWL